jgi:HEAT repeat protein
MKRGVSRLGRSLKVRPGEGSIAVRLLALFVLVWAGAAIGSTGVESLLFARFGPDALPGLYVALGLVALPTMLGMTALVARPRPGRILAAVPLALAAVLVPAWVVVQLDERWFYPVLWLLMMVVWTVQGMAMWGLAGTVSDTRQAKRLFPLYAAGLILGSAAGGVLTRPLASWLHAENLVLVWAGALGAAFLLARSVAGKQDRRTVRREARRGVPAELRGALGYVRRSSLLRAMAVALAGFGLLYFTLTLPFARGATTRFPDADRLAGFLGAFFGLVNAAALLVSLLAANRLFARFGVTTMVLALPAIYLAGFAALALREGFVLLVGFRFLQMVWVNAVWAPGWQALFNVVPPERRSQVRTLMDAGPLQVGTVLAGGVLLAGQTLAPRYLYLLGAGFAALTTLAMWRARQSYRAAVVEALREGWPEVFVSEEEPFGGFAQDRAAQEALQAGVADPDPRVRLISVQILEGLQAPSGDRDLVSAINDPDAEVRVVALEALVRRGAGVGVDRIVPLLADPDPRVRSAAVGALAVQDVPPATLADHLRPLLGDPDPSSRALAAVVLAREGAGDAARTLDSMRTDGRPAWRAAAMEALASIRSRDVSTLAAGLTDPDPSVRRAAVHALSSSGADAALQPLVEALGDADPAVRKTAAETIAGLDGEASGRLIRALGSPQLEEGALEALGRSGSAPASPLLAYAVRQAAEGARYHELWTRLGPRATGPLGLLADALRWRALAHAEAALKAMAPVRSRQEMDLAMDALRSRHPAQVADALEVLDAVGEPEVVRPLLPLWEPVPAARPDPPRVVRASFSDVHPWVRACAAWAASELTEPTGHRELEDLATTDPDTLVREAAGWSLRGESIMQTVTTIPLVHRILFLRQVPLFTDLSPPDLKHVAEAATEHLYGDGELIAEIGEPGEEMHVVVSGEIGVVGAAGSEIARRRSGDTVGEMAILSQQPRMATLVAVDAVRTLSLDRRRFERIVLERPQTSLAVMRTLCDRLREADTRESASSGG